MIAPSARCTACGAWADTAHLAVSLLAAALAEQQQRCRAEEGEFDARDPGELRFYTGRQLLDAVNERAAAYGEATRRRA